MSRGDKKNQPIDISWWIILALALMLTMLIVPAYAQVQSNDMNAQTAGNIGGNDALALGFGGASFDVDIAQCVGSQSDTFFFGIYGKQRLRQNYWCHAITLANAGYIEAAEYMLCHHTVLSNMPDCPGNIFRPEPKGEGASGPANAVAEEVEELEQYAQEQFNDYQMQITDLSVTVQQLQDKPAQIVYRVPPEIQSQMEADADRRQKAREAWKGEH